MNQLLPSCPSWSRARAALLTLSATLLSALPCLAQRAVDDGFEPIRRGDPVELSYAVPFFEGSTYDTRIPPPESVLGDVHGSRLSHHDEIVECFRRWSAISDRVQLVEHGRTYEGRPLVHVLVSSPENLARLEELRAGHGRLADPRELSEADGQQLVDSLPAVAWMGYSIHGDELSGADGAVALGYHLAASTDAAVTSLLDELLIVIDPCMNPDGRERIVAMVEQSAGYVPNLDYDSMQRGRWPWGRGNHYLFDLNRDWMTGVHPETRGRWDVAGRYHPQLFVDAHEMGSLDNFLFYPQSAPHNPYLPERLGAWHQVFAGDMAAAFDRQGWAYYTREWADAWGPFYSDAWGSLHGAIGILYEQASTRGFPLRLASGQIRTYRESVHHQALASLANLTTLQANRREVLADYLAHKRANVAAETPGNDRLLVVMPGRNPGRERALAQLLTRQGVEVFRSDEHRQVQDVIGVYGERMESLDVPPGAWLVPARQPLRPYVRAYLGFDIRLGEEFLLKERHELETKGRTKLYDATAWSLPLLYDLEAYWATGAASGELVADLADPAGGLAADGDADAVAWVVDGTDDHSVAFAARAMEAGLAVHLAEKSFQTGGRSYPRGSLVVRRADNDAEGLAARVESAAREAGVTAYTTRSGRSPDEGPDLGGGHFLLLERPRVAMLSNAPVAPDEFGALWFQLDHESGVPVSFLDAQMFGGYDLRRYNVIVVPPGYGLGGMLAGAKSALATWVQSGGTLIACGNAASAIAVESMGLTNVRRRRDVLKELDDYAYEAQREHKAREVTLDLEALWLGPGAGDGGAMAGAGAGAGTGTGAAAGAATGAATGAGAGAGTGAGAAAGTGAGAGAGTGTGAGAGAATGAATGAGAAAGAGADAAADADPKPKSPKTKPDAARQDAWARRFSPAGVLVRGLVDDEAWITSGFGDEMPVLVSGSTAFMSRDPVRTPVRLAVADDLRLSGLLWPEARERLARSAWLTVERKGRGQVILFAANPARRGHFVAGARLFGNAVVYGPGAGASPPIDW